jgi:hypothetical protein
MELALEHRDHVVHPLLDAWDAVDVLVVVEHVSVGDREVDALDVDEVEDVADRAERVDRHHAEIVAVIERLGEVRGVPGERALEQSAGQADCPIVEAKRPGVLILPDRLVGKRERPLRQRRHLLGQNEWVLRYSLEARAGEHGNEANEPQQQRVHGFPSPSRLLLSTRFLDVDAFRNLGATPSPHDPRYSEQR